MSDVIRIVAYILVSTLIMMAAIWLAARSDAKPAPTKLVIVALLISVLGILFGKFGANLGLPWQIYYTVPALATVLLPPLVFRFSLWRTAFYWLLAAIAAPLIHALFFYTLGWGDYMPFLHLPALP
ncbi:MAG: hypothetical protein ABUL42_00435 [Terricaulis silvestris]